MKLFLLLSSIFFCIFLHAQPGDFVVIKSKNGQTIRTFLNGANVTFQTNNYWTSGKIINIKNDSLFFREVVVKQVSTPWGVPKLDTITSYIRKIHYRDISAIPRKNESFSYIKNGTLLMLGGGGYMLLNIVNGSYLHYSILGKENRPGLLTAAGVFGIGFLMKKLHKPYLKIGKKYKVEYVNMKTP